MANQRREANRARAQQRARNGMAQREPEQREPRYRGEGYDRDGKHGTASRTSGSSAHVGESVGPGPVPGAGELAGIGGPGPGAQRGLVKPSPDENPIGKTPSGAAPKGMAPAATGDED